MEDLNEKYFFNLRNNILEQENQWKNKCISNKQALDFLQGKRQEICFFINNSRPSHLRTKMSGLLEYVNILINQIKDEMKNVYIVHFKDNQTIVCADESLLKKCLDRLENDSSIKPIKTTICQTEEDLDMILPKKEAKLDGDFVYLEFHGLPQDNKKQSNSDDIINTFGETYE